MSWCFPHSYWCTWLAAALPREADDWRISAAAAALTTHRHRPGFVHLHTDFWERAAAYVRAGGVLYARLPPTLHP
jgi:hypothetical protein